MTHSFFTTTTRGLQRDIPPMRLYEKAKRLGIWNPSDIDLSQDKLDWQRLRDDERDMILRHHTPNYRTIFYEALPQAMRRLLTDGSPAAQVQAFTTYNMIVEGVLAETGYLCFLHCVEAQ